MFTQSFSTKYGNNLETLTYFNVNTIQKFDLCNAHFNSILPDQNRWRVILYFLSGEENTLEFESKELAQEWIKVNLLNK